MYADNFPPLTFEDLAHVVQRESWGLGQVTCPDGSTADTSLDCLPVNTNPGANALTNALQNQIASSAVSPYYITLFGMQIPLGTAILGGLAALVVAGAIFGGRR